MNTEAKMMFELSSETMTVMNEDAPGDSSTTQGLPSLEHKPATNRKRLGGWSRAMTNFVLDALLAVDFVALLAVTGVIRFVFPDPSLSEGWTLWGQTLGGWLQIQFVVMAVLGAGVVLHVMLHWKWVCNMLTRGGNSSLKTDDGIQTLVGVGFLAVVLHIIGLTVLAGMLTVARP